MSSVASVSLNLNAGLYGDPAVAAMGIVTKVFTFIMSVVIGFGQGFQPVVGFNYGAGRLDRVRESVKFSLKSCTLVLTAAAVIGFLFAPQVIHFFREDTEVIAIGARAFRFQCVSLPLGRCWSLPTCSSSRWGAPGGPPSWPYAGRGCSLSL